MNSYARPVSDGSEPTYFIATGFLRGVPLVRAAKRGTWTIVTVRCHPGVELRLVPQPPADPVTSPSLEADLSRPVE